MSTSRLSEEIEKERNGTEYPNSSNMRSFIDGQTSEEGTMTDHEIIIDRGRSCLTSAANMRLLRLVKSSSKFFDYDRAK